MYDSMYGKGLGSMLWLDQREGVQNLDKLVNFMFYSSNQLPDPDQLGE
jgi:hypothetical protein